MTFWSSREIEPLTLRLSRMPTTGGSGENADTSTQRSDPVVSRQIYVHPDKFYGYPNDDCLDWFASFERIARANEWDDAKCGRMISAYLRGPAGDHFEKIDARDKANYDVIKKSITDRFCPADMRRSAYGTLASRKQGKMESVTEFAAVIQRLVFRSFPSEVSNDIIEMTAREHFILGLKPNLMRRVTMADPKTFSDAIRVALREESLEESLAPQRVSSVEPQNDQMTQVIGLLTKLLEKKDSPGNSRNNFRRNNRFQNSGGRNKSFNSRPVCNFCNKSGHVERTCWKKFPDLRSGSENGKNQGN